MFATSTKTATFLLKSCFSYRCQRAGGFGPRCVALNAPVVPPLRSRPRVPVLDLVLRNRDRAIGSVRWDRWAGGPRPKCLLDEELGDRVAVARRIEDEEIDRADVTAGLHGWADRQDGATHDLPT